MIQTSVRGEYRQMCRLRDAVAPQINKTNPQGNRRTRRHAAKILRTKVRKVEAYKKLDVTPWWLKPKVEATT